MTSDVDAAGHYLLRNHTLVTLLFMRIVLRRLDGFNQQNVIFSLDISPIDPEPHESRHFSVELSSSYGAGGSFDCERIIVRDVRPWATAVS